MQFFQNIILVSDIIKLWWLSLLFCVFIGWWGCRSYSSYDDLYKTLSPFAFITAIHWGIIDKVLSYYSNNIYCQLAELNTRNSKAYYSLCEKAELWGDGYVSMGIFIVLLIIVYLWNRNKGAVLDN